MSSEEERREAQEGLRDVLSVWPVIDPDLKASEQKIVISCNMFGIMLIMEALEESFNMAQVEQDHVGAVNMAHFYNTIGAVWGSIDAHIIAKQAIRETGFDPDE